MKADDKSNCKQIEKLIFNHGESEGREPTDEEMRIFDMMKLTDKLFTYPDTVPKGLILARQKLQVNRQLVEMNEKIHNNEEPKIDTTCENCKYCCSILDLPFMDNKCPVCEGVKFKNVTYKERLEIELKSVRKEAIKLFEQNKKLDKAGFSMSAELTYKDRLIEAYEAQISNEKIRIIKKYIFSEDDR